jgi:hypothetical protein
VDNVNEILKSYTPISLKEMDSVALMDRTDTKFVFREIDLPAFLEQVKDDYRVLEVNGNRISRYETLYYDTPKFELYSAHQRGKPSRYKIRSRKYVESNINFFEVKFKNNKGRTIKNRIRQDEIHNDIRQEAGDLLREKTNILPESLESKLWTNFSRITLVNKHSAERVTIDIHLTFVDNNDTKEIKDLVIAEVKQDKSINSAFLKMMKQYHVREGSMSKYCYGVINLISKMKHNNFKPNLITIKKTLYGTFARN